MYSFGIKKRTSRYKQNQTHNIHQLTILPDSFEWTPSTTLVTNIRHFKNKQNPQAQQN